MRLRSYQLLRRLGVGADGEVWAAADPQGQEVALKARPRQAAEEEPRIFREFERLRTLRIPNVVRVLTVDADQGYVFFAMELARGEPLDRHVQRGAALDERARRCAAAGAGVARALAGIHRLRLSHRDIKPANVHVTDEGTVTVLDFGTSHFGEVAEAEDEGLVGTPHYMAPEQRIGLPHDHRVDLYALGVTLHEALSGRPAGGWTMGRPRPSLALLGPAVPLALADLVDRLLALDPADRPSAEETQDLLERIATGKELPPAPWPSPSRYAGDPSRLLEQSAVVVGPPGSGRRRMVQEARWHWYRRGYRSLAGACRGDQPWGALAAVLAELLRPLSAEDRAALLGAEAGPLATVWPALPLPAGAPAPRTAEPVEVGRALAAVLDRAAPLAVALWELDEADPGTARAVPVLAQSVGARVRLWATARRPGFGLRTLLPPAWTAEAQAEILGELLPEGEAPPTTLLPCPLRACAFAWRALARQRGEPGPADPPEPGVEALAVLDPPFPRGVAEALCPGSPCPGSLRDLLASGQVRPWSTEEGQETRTLPRGREALVLADHGARLLALAGPADLSARRLAAATAWRQSPDQPERVRQAAALAARGGRPADALLRAAIREELELGRTVELDRWLRLHALHHGPPDEADFELAFARLLADLDLSPPSVDRARLEALEQRARDGLEAGRAWWLRVVFEARRGDKALAVRRGTEQADAVAPEHPALAADILREVSLAWLAQGEVRFAVRDARRALALARDAAQRSGRAVPRSRSESTATTTLSAALLYAGRVREATDLCEEGARRCREEGQARGEGALLANRGIGLLYLGLREPADAALARAREVQARHRDPVVLANLSVTQARLAVERGDLAATPVLVAEGLTAAEAVGDPHLVGEAWCVVLEAAVHRADPAEAQRALSGYGAAGVGSSWDHWPAVLARWRWLTGDLRGALAATDEPREGHGELCIRAERCRLLLVAGSYPQAAHEGQALADAAESLQYAELARFARLVAAAARGAPDAEVHADLLDTRASRWVHLYLGALHLDAIRRRLRGENVDALLRQLRARSGDVGHRLYSALGRAEGW
ncbi:serine/threonine-protein kinase [Myxococcota bacterium]|nr:serine/threonine-protein kinase [Myxococcota bacterium]